MADGSVVNALSAVIRHGRVRYGGLVMDGMSSAEELKLEIAVKKWIKGLEEAPNLTFCSTKKVEFDHPRCPWCLDKIEFAFLEREFFPTAAGSHARRMGDFGYCIPAQEHAMCSSCGKKVIGKRSEGVSQSLYTVTYPEHSRAREKRHGDGITVDADWVTVLTVSTTPDHEVVETYERVENATVCLDRYFHDIQTYYPTKKVKLCGKKIPAVILYLLN